MELLQLTNRPCKNCGKSQATTRAGSVTSYFFQHNYCQCQKKPAEAKQEKHPSSDSNSSSSPKEQSPRICTNCGKARPEDRRIGSFTSFLFKELRCQCASTSVAKKRNADLDNRGDSSSSSKGDGMGNLSGSRSQTASRVAQKRQFATKFKAGSQSQTAGQPYCQSGTIIGGTFKIISIIGEGGMGVVYLVNHLGLNKPFALKVLTPNLVNEQNWLRFQAEARTLSALNHSSLVKVYDLGIHEKTVPFYSMDYLKGRNLEEILCQQGRLELKQALAVFLTMLDGLAYAHRNGVVHRDIKPANIFICSPASTTNESANQVIDDETEVKILDFGISKLVSSANKSQHLTSAGEIFGSPYYMSPEQCRGEAVDARSDIYSVGCTLFEALTGFVPFEGKNGIEISLMHEEDEPPHLEDVLPNSTFPPGLELVLAKCLAKLPQNRYQSAKELAIDLTRIKDGKIIEGYARARNRATLSEEEEEEDTARPRLRPTVSIFVAGGVLSIGLVLAFATLVAIQRSTQTPKEDSTVSSTESPALVRVRKMFGDELVKFDSNPTQPVPNETIERFLQAQTGFYSKSKIIGSKKVKVFSFPKQFSIGSITSINKIAVRKSEARGEVVIESGSTINFTADTIVADYTELLKFFRPDELESLSIAAADSNKESLLTNVSALSSLKELNLSHCELTERDLVSLNRLNKLKTLSIKLASTDGAALAKYKYLKQLHELHIDTPTHLTPLLRALKTSQNLDWLAIEHATLSKEDIRELASLQQLRCLVLNDSSVSNADLESLTALKHLLRLDIRRCNKLDINCIGSLKKLTSLQIVLPPDTLISPEIERELRKALPKLHYFGE
jgi:serine/threonine protein kinase